MMLMLPTWPVKESVDHFTSKGHWAISSTLTTNHLLAIVALTNTLMSMNSAAFSSFDGKILRQTIPRQIKQEVNTANSGMPSDVQTKQGWSLMATLHCVLLPDICGNSIVNYAFN